MNEELSPEEDLIDEELIICVDCDDQMKFVVKKD